MSKQAEAAAEKIFERAFGASGDAIGLQEMFAGIIDREYQERERAVAELVAAARERQMCGFGAAGCQACNTRLNEAIGGVEAG